MRFPPLQGSAYRRAATTRPAAVDWPHRRLPGDGEIVTDHPHIEVLANDNHTVALLRSTAQRDDKTLDMNYVLVFHIGDGKITEGWELWRDRAALAEFWP